MSRRSDGHAGLALAAAAYLLLAATAHAGPVYRCVDAHGAVSFQDRPCPRTSTQKQLHLPAAPPAPRRPMAPATPPAAAATAAAAPAPRAGPVHVPLPVLYGCNNAVTGEYYITATPRPGYLAPLGATGVLQPSLGEVYGARGGSRLSAPETHDQPTPGLTGHTFVRVRDTCRRLDHGQTCAALRRMQDDNAEALRQAFSEDEAALEQRAAELQAQLAGC
ncbi:MAG TPA: DUF4124 domain-containing protein [Rhodanobacteraceae bacterium]|nr:DUF4124 domain-containing protein [Rhodanobacteraceae bacterium]